MILKRTYHLLLLLLCSCSLTTNTLASSKSVKTDSVQFIVIANVGASGYSVAPLIISTDSIKNISYDKNIYDFNLKYRGFRNVVISNENFEKLFCHLSISKKHNIRVENFTKSDEKYKLIIDFRDINNYDYELLSVKSITSIFYVLKNLYCYLESNSINQEILTHINALYKFYLNTYDNKGEYYKSDISCE